MIRLHACPTAWERSEWRQPCRVFLIRRYQVASADRAGDGCVTSRLLVAGLPTGAWGEPSDLITMVTSALFIRWHRGVVHSRHLLLIKIGNLVSVYYTTASSAEELKQHAGVRGNLFCESASWIPDGRFAKTMVSKLGDKDHMASVLSSCLFCRCQKQVCCGGVSDCLASSLKHQTQQSTIFSWITNYTFKRQNLSYFCIKVFIKNKYILVVYSVEFCIYLIPFSWLFEERKYNSQLWEQFKKMPFSHLLLSPLKNIKPLWPAVSVVCGNIINPIHDRIETVSQLPHAAFKSVIASVFQKWNNNMSVRNIIVESTGASSVPRVRERASEAEGWQFRSGVLNAGERCLKLRTL